MLENAPALPSTKPLHLAAKVKEEGDQLEQWEQARSACTGHVLGCWPADAGHS